MAPVQTHALAAAAPPAVAAVRRFSRFYTRRMGLLDEHLLDSRFSLAETRVLFELAQRPGLSAGELAAGLVLDAGYLSRILKRFDGDGLLARRRSKDDARRSVLSLTARGRAAFATLDRASSRQVRALVDRLAPGPQRELVDSMARIESVLEAGTRAARETVLREHRVGDIGWIVHRQGLLYAQEYGWDASFEALVAEIAARFIRHFDAERERCWVAEQEGHTVGAVFLVRKSLRVAQLRLLYVEPAVRGQGVGRRLITECVGFARQAGYRSITLWTNDVLDAARHLYQVAGFELVSQDPHQSFGKSLVGQHWTLRL